MYTYIQIAHSLRLEIYTQAANTYGKWKLITLIYVSIVHCLMDFLRCPPSFALLCAETRFALRTNAMRRFDLRPFGWSVFGSLLDLRAARTGGISSIVAAAHCIADGLCLVNKIRQTQKKHTIATKKTLRVLAFYIDERRVAVCVVVVVGD